MLGKTILLEKKVVRKIILSVKQNFVGKSVLIRINFCWKKKIVGKKIVRKKFLLEKKLVTDFVADFVSDKSMFIDVCIDIYVRMSSNLYGMCSTVSTGLDQVTGLLGQVSQAIQD